MQIFSDSPPNNASLKFPGECTDKVFCFFPDFEEECFEAKITKSY